MGAAKLELVDYHNKTSLIRGWDELFSKLDDNLSSLSSMKQSPYYKVFEDDALAWEDKLTRLRVLFDIWIDVQRRWVYLEGIFYGSADIKQQLPMSLQDLNPLIRVCAAHAKCPYEAWSLRCAWITECPSHPRTFI